MDFSILWFRNFLLECSAKEFLAVSTATRPKINVTDRGLTVTGRDSKYPPAPKGAKECIRLSVTRSREPTTSTGTATRGEIVSLVKLNSFTAALSMQRTQSESLSLLMCDGEAGVASCHPGPKGGSRLSSNPGPKGGSRTSKIR